MHHNTVAGCGGNFFHAKISTFSSSVIKYGKKEEMRKMKTFEDVVDFLKKAGTYYLATDDRGQPRVRPFGTAHVFEGRLYIQTGKKKEVSRQMHENPRIEICAFMDGQWMRISGQAVEDDRREARKNMLDAYPELRNMYNEDDGNTEVFFITDGEAVFSSFTAPSESVRLP